MAGQDLAQIHAGEHITVEHHHRVVAQLRRDIGNAAAGAQRFHLGHILDLQTELGAVAELRLECLGPVGGPEDDVLDTSRGDARQQVGQERHTRGGEHRLGGRNRQRPQPSSLSADQNDGVDLRRVDCAVVRLGHRVPFVSCRRDLRTAARDRTFSAPFIVHRSGACHHPK